MMKRMVRIFVSSTFKNFKDERNALTNTVYPKLEKLCNENGFSFQVIDLRWGVSREDVAENNSAQVCFNEIARCMEMSPYINFLIMAGNRYGWKPLPNRISVEDWNAITSGLEKDTQLFKYLNEYYDLDENDLKNPGYVLKARDESNNNCAENDEPLRLQLYERAKERIPERCEQYNTSATEAEIMIGYFEQDKELRNRTLLLLKEGTPPELENEPEPEDDVQQAEELFQKLNDSVDVPERCYKYEIGDDRYLEVAEKFLTTAIEKQISLAPPLDGFQPERESLKAEYRAVEAQYIPFSDHEGIMKKIHENAKGKCVLLTGASGSGKSFFLKHLASKLTSGEDDCAVAAVFTDILPRCRNLSDALGFLEEELSCQKLFTEKVSEPLNLRHPVRWFERRLAKLNREKRIFLIIDTLEEFIQSPESILQIVLPENVTLIAGIPDTSMLRNSVDMEPRHPVEYQLKPLEENTVMRVLTDLLKKRGRCLQTDQVDAAFRCLKACPDKKFTPIYMELFAQKMSRIRGWDRVEYFPPISFQNLLREVLLQQNKDTYKVFRLHALGFLALAKAGLSESELLSLLSKDPDVVAEIHSQTEWDFSILKFNENAAEEGSNYKGKIPVVLWAMLYAEIHSLLTEYDCAGIQLIQIRHNLLKKEIISILVEDGLKQNLLNIMCEYFSQANWYVRDNKSVTGNRRKATELFSIYERLDQLDALHHCMKDLNCVDAYVRCGMRHEILDYFLRYASDPLEFRLLDLLQRKDLLYRLWPDSFLQSAAELSGLDETVITDALKQGGVTYSLHRNSSGFSEKGVFFPQLRGRREFALNNNGIVAALCDSLIQLIDLNRGIALPAFCIAPDEECFMYWENNELVVRYEESKYYYTYSDGRIQSKEYTQCKKWDGLVTYDPVKIESAGGMRERDTFCHFPTGRIVHYCQNGRLEQEMLFYEDEDPYTMPELKVRLHGELCAVIVNASMLEVVDLSRKRILYHKKISMITHVEWSDDGSKLLVVIKGNTLLQIPIDKEKPIGPMRQPKCTYQQDRMHMLSAGLNDLGKTVWDFAGERSNAVERKSAAENMAPLFYAISIRHEFIACYYRILSDSKLSIHHLDDFRQIGHVRSYVITKDDAKKIPLYQSVGHNGVILISEGKPRIFDLERKKWTKADPSLLREIPRSKTMEAKIKEEYLCYLISKMSPGREADTGLRTLSLVKGAVEIDEPQASDMNFAEKRGKSNLFKHLLKKNQDNNSEKEKSPINPNHLELLHDGENYWLVDRVNGIVSAYNSMGNCLVRDMVGGIVAADTVNGGLYILTEAAEKIVSFRIVKI